ncbi:MAG: vWA domain-containing protein [Myxococcota bacterium]
MSSITLKEATQSLVAQGALTQATATALGADSRSVGVADVSMLYDDPVFSCFLIDESGSMSPYKQSVIEGQAAMVESLRASMKCKKGSLFVAQYLFSSTVRALHPFSALQPKGPDKVLVLDDSKYAPSGNTALYKSLYYLLQDMAANLASAAQNQVKASLTIGVITDGEDTEKGIDPAEIKKVISELRGQKFLRKSVVIGLTHSRFTQGMLDELRERLGFDEAISLTQSDPKAVRHAFVLASQSAVSGQGPRP